MARSGSSPRGFRMPFHGQLDSTNRLPALVWTRNPAGSTAATPWVAGMVAASVLLPGFVWLVCRRENSATRLLGRVSLAAALALAGWLGGPLWLASGGGLAVLGRLTRS